MGLFGKMTNINNEVVVTTKEELKAALKAKEPVIIAKGEVAKSLQWRAKITPAKAVALAASLAVAVGAAGTAVSIPISAPFSAPISAIAATGTAIEVGFSAGTVAITSAGVFVLELGAALIIAILRDYNVEFTDLGKDIRLSLKK